MYRWIWMFMLIWEILYNLTRHVPWYVWIWMCMLIWEIIYNQTRNEPWYMLTWMCMLIWGTIYNQTRNEPWYMWIWMSILTWKSLQSHLTCTMEWVDLNVHADLSNLCSITWNVPVDLIVHTFEKSLQYNYTCTGFESWGGAGGG